MAVTPGFIAIEPVPAAAAAGLAAAAPCGEPDLPAQLRPVDGDRTSVATGRSALVSSRIELSQNAETGTRDTLSSDGNPPRSDVCSRNSTVTLTEGGTRSADTAHQRSWRSSQLAALPLALRRCYYDFGFSRSSRATAYSHAQVIPLLAAPATAAPLPSSRRRSTNAGAVPHQAPAPRGWPGRTRQRTVFGDHEIEQVQPWHDPLQIGQVSTGDRDQASGTAAQPFKAASVGRSTTPSLAMVPS